MSIIPIHGSPWCHHGRMLLPGLVLDIFWLGTELLLKVDLSHFWSIPEHWAHILNRQWLPDGGTMEFEILDRFILESEGYLFSTLPSSDLMRLTGQPFNFCSIMLTGFDPMLPIFSTVDFQDCVVWKDCLFSQHELISKFRSFDVVLNVAVYLEKSAFRPIITLSILNNDWADSLALAPEKPNQRLRGTPYNFCQALSCRMCRQPSSSRYTILPCARRVIMTHGLDHILYSKLTKCDSWPCRMSWNNGSPRRYERAST